MRLKVFAVIFLLPLIIFAQENKLSKVDFLIGKWKGNGSGFSGGNSNTTSVFKYSMNNKYIEVTNESVFKPTEKNPKGDHHIDKGFIYYNKDLNKIVLRQFNIEGYVNTYVLVDSISTDKKVVFETIKIENFIPGGKAKWTVEKLSEDELITTFDVSFGKDYKCFGKNRLTKIKEQ